MIVDDHPMVRRGLRSLLSSYDDFEVTAEADCAEAALRLARMFPPDVILLDLQLPDSGGVDLVQQLGRQTPMARIIVLTAFDNDDYLAGALRAGAYAYLLKSTCDETVVNTIRRVHQGERVLSSSLMTKVLREFGNFAQAHAFYESRLSREQLEVLKLIASGATSEEIAKETHWSERTVRRETEEILSKMGAKNRAHAVAEAIRRGLM
jgi:DNA-binding NarL/FixJ family response regulator